MHDRAADPMGAAISATAIATEIMILLSIEVRIAQVRLPVEGKRSEVFRTCSPCFSQGVAGNFHFLRAFFRWQFLQAICNNGDYNSILNHQKTVMKDDNLESIAAKLVAPGKGILAADESSGTIEKRLKSISVPSTEENRRAYREVMFTTAGAGEFISGVILFDETIRQKTSDGRTFVKALEEQGIIPGIKVDKGAKAMANFPAEKITEGLDGLRERLAEYRKLGARFAKWRAVIAIAENIPTQTCIDANAEALARYAALCQEEDLVPIVEPEVLMDGTHTIERYFEVTQQTLESVFHALYEHRVSLEGMLLKPNMVLSGKDCPQQASVQEVAEATVRCLKRVVPAAVPGIVFLSGGQTDQQATEHLNAMNQLPGLPWQLSFSYGRALQAPVLRAWKGEQANVAKAQEAFHHRAWCNSKARFGKYTEEMETAKAA
jgi:fructose-bisphosphate aldolase, class I